jgi:hypothetical protein
VPDSDAELLETLLTKVMRLVAMHGDSPGHPIRGGRRHPAAAEWHERHERMLAAMTQHKRRAPLLGLGALARELAAFHGDTTRAGNRSPRHHDPAG